jgi:hypothetical protein
VGGIGSGRRPGEGRKRVTTDEVPALDVRDLKRQGLIAAGQERVRFVTRFRKRSRANLAPGEKRMAAQDPGSYATDAAGAWRSSTDLRAPRCAANAEASATPASLDLEERRSRTNPYVSLALLLWPPRPRQALKHREGSQVVVFTT